MTGFQAPNYTQVPNDYFDLIIDMTIAEIKVLSTLLRVTLGYHRDEITLTIREMARITQLDPKSVMAGATKLEARGLIERTVGKTTTVTKWRVVIDDVKLWEKIVKTVGNGSEEKGELPYNKKKKSKESEDEPARHQISDSALAEISRAYEEEIGMLTPMIADDLKAVAGVMPVQWILDAIHEAAVQNKRGWKYVLAILTRWKAQGNQEAMKPMSQRASTYKPRDLIQERYGGIMEWAKEAQEHDDTTRNGNDHGANSSSVPQLEA